MAAARTLTYGYRLATVQALSTLVPPGVAVDSWVFAREAFDPRKACAAASHKLTAHKPQIEKADFMANVTIFGTGNMGTAIADVLTAGGSTVDHIGHADPRGPVNGDIVILAVYYAALKDILGEYADKFAGKTVVDITNPVNLESFDSLLPPPESSSAAELAAALPSSQVIKAFNTTFAGTLSARKVGPITTTVLVAGDDADSKAALIEAVKAGGVEAIDAGTLNRARELDAPASLPCGQGRFR